PHLETLWASASLPRWKYATKLGPTLGRLASSSGTRLPFDERQAQGAAPRDVFDRGLESIFVRRKKAGQRDQVIEAQPDEEVPPSVETQPRDDRTAKEAVDRPAH